ncbi:MAG TPA: flagellar motor switch protein FliG [Gammaproteobacteria bacterium]|nr:flagellar motor switch protein FliG [Gammaproteobacteria bacterium]
MSDAAYLSGRERAAVLMLAIGEEAAAEVLKELGPREVQTIGAAMAKVQSINRSSVASVLNDLNNSIQDEVALGMNSEDYIRTLLVNALGEDKANSLLDRIFVSAETRGMDALKWMDARMVAELIKNEHPQIIAIILSFLEADHAADVIMNFSDKVRVDVVMRIATLDRVQPRALAELDKVIESQFMGDASAKSANVGGVKMAANIVNMLDSSVEGELMDNVREVDSEIGQRMSDLMFVFDNLLEVDDRGMQALLREVESETLLLALKGAEGALREKVFSNMSRRAAELLKDDLDSKGPVRVSEVEGAQKEILTIARRLAESGEIILGGKGADEFI